MPFSTADVYAIRDIFVLSYEDEASISTALDAQYSHYGDRAVADIRDLIEQINEKTEAISKVESADRNYQSIRVEGEYEIEYQKGSSVIPGVTKPNLWREKALLINKLSALTGIFPNSGTLTMRS